MQNGDDLIEDRYIYKRRKKERGEKSIHACTNIAGTCMDRKEIEKKKRKERRLRAA